MHNVKKENETLYRKIILPKGTPHKKRKKNLLIYIDIFLKRYNNLLPLYPNSKEITESMGAVMCLWDKFDIDRSDKNTICYVLGDGRTPRTGALISVSSCFHVCSIDPLINLDHNNFVDRLFVY